MTNNIITDYRNPKTNDVIESRLTIPEAVEILRPHANTNDFINSLVNAFDNGGYLSEARMFWIIKLADEKAAGKDIQPIELLSDVISLLNRTKQIMWKFEDYGRIKLYIQPDNRQIKVFHSGGDNTSFAGIISRAIGSGKCCFYPVSRTYCGVVSAQIRLFSEDPEKFLKAVGKTWGRCCVCGRTLENEQSVAAGIGPICAEKAGW